MSGFVPEILYNNKKLAHIQAVLDPKPPKKNVVLEGIRGAGCLIIGGGTSSYDIVLTGIMLADDTQLPDGSAYAKPTGTEYEKIMEQKNYLETVIPAENTDRTLKVEKSDGSYNSYTVRRITDIEYPANQRISVQEYTVRFKVVNP
jgi:hypothetical protein